MTVAEFVPPAIGELRHWVALQGWKSQERGWHRDYQMKCWRRPGEKLNLIWRDGEFSAEESWFESPEVDHRPVQNPALASNVLRTHDPAYDFSAMSDREVLDHLFSRKITWLSTMTQETASVTLPARTTISTSTMGRRFLTFADQSFQSVALDAIIDIL